MAAIEKISKSQATQIIATQEGQFADVKAIEILPSKLTKTISAFANSDGGELYIGIEEKDGASKNHAWRGFPNPEAANAHLETFERFFPLGMDYQYEFLQCDAFPGLVLHVTVNKTLGVINASNGTPYLRRGAQCLPVDGNEALRRLEYSKGVVSFEANLTDATPETVIASPIIKDFLTAMIPTAQAEPWLRKQRLLRDEKPTVAGVLLFAEEPQAVLPKRCGIKVYRYKTKDPKGFREALAFDPRTVEGCLYDQIKEAVQLTTEITEKIPKLGEDSLKEFKYPNETLHEIITNAVIHRDYSVADDVHIRIFDNRIEVQSPGRLPAHITAENILNERFARNGVIVRLLNKFPNAPNKDVGEGLRTAFAAMHSFGLKEPGIIEKDNAVVVIIKHEPLASSEESIMMFLDEHHTIKKAEAREVTHLGVDQISFVLKRMLTKRLIEKVPGTRARNTAYRKPHLQNTKREGEPAEMPQLVSLLTIAEAVIKHLEAHDTVRNSDIQKLVDAREGRIRITFHQLVKKGIIEQVPGTRTSNTQYRKT